MSRGLLPGPIFILDNYISFLHILQHFDSLQALPWRGLGVVPDLAEGCGLGLNLRLLPLVALSPILLVALAGFLRLLVALIHALHPL